MPVLKQHANGSASSFFLGLIAVVCIAWSGWFLFVNPGRLKEILFPIPPCSQPIAYSIGIIDPRFGLTTSTILGDIEKAGTIWSGTMKKSLFKYDPKGALKINFIYDNRQAATDKLKELGYHISNDRASYDSLKSKYDLLKSQVKTKQASLDSQTANFNAKSDAYEAEVKRWNEQGGVTPDIAARLNKESTALAAERDRLKQAIDDYNQQAAQLNDMVTVVNGLAKSLNIVADQANVVSGNGKEFEEGEYVVDKNGKEINIYEFDTEKRLIRVLAHEFGHALGLDHVDDPNAIMYYLNQDTTDSLSDTDVKQLTTLCSGKK